VAAHAIGSFGVGGDPVRPGWCFGLIRTRMTPRGSSPLAVKPRHRAESTTANWVRWPRLPESGHPRGALVDRKVISAGRSLEVVSRGVRCEREPKRCARRGWGVRRSGAQRAFLRCIAGAGFHHQGRQQPCPPAARRGSLAHRARYQTGKTMRDRWELAPPAARARGDAGNHRLHDRWISFNLRRKRAVIANVAIARELAGWCWSLAVMD
jgi:hypothetical protein